MGVRSREDVMRIVQRLCNITVERGASPSEAEGAAAKVRALLDEHDLSLFDVQAQRFDEEIIDKRHQLKFTRMPTWCLALACQIAAAYDCEGGTYRNPELGRGAFFIGHKTDVEVASYMFSWLSQVLFDLATEAGRSRGYTHARLISYRQSFIVAAAAAIKKRLLAERQTRIKANPTAGALVPVKAAAIDAWMKQNKLKPRLVRGQVSDFGTTDGRTAGNELELRRGVSKGERAGLLFGVDVKSDFCEDC